ncbi:hypothetical protein Hanom_Chr00s020912g01760051 [Helianthus anomalus]
MLFLETDLFGAEILRVSMLLENASALDQSGLEHAMFSNGGANRWTSPLQSEIVLYLCHGEDYLETFDYYRFLVLSRCKISW